MPGKVACFHGVTGRGWSNEPVVSARGLRATLAAARLADEGEVDAGDRPPMPDARETVEPDAGNSVEDAAGGAIGVGLGLGEVPEG